MTNEPRDDRPLAEVVPLHPAAPDAVLAVPADTSYEIELDDRPAPGPAVYADITSPHATATVYLQGAVVAIDNRTGTWRSFSP